MSITERLRHALGNVPLEPFHPASFDLIHHYNGHMLARDISAGLTVGMVAMPLAMAFAIASGVTPEAGLYTSIIAGLLIALLGGCRVQIGGPAGAFIVIIYGIIADYGLANLMIATIGSGILLFLMGLLKIGNLIRFIPVSIVIGFTNGIAVLIALSQVKDFLGLRIDNMPADFFGQMQAIYTHIGTINYYALGIALISFFVIKFWPKDLSTRTAQWKRWVAKIPGTVVVLVFSTLAVSSLNLPVETIGSKFGGIPQALPSIQMPELSGLEFSRMIPESTRIVFTTAFGQYALDGYKVNALHYLLKPISYNDFMEAVNKAIQWFELRRKAEGNNQPAVSSPAVINDYIYVKSDYKLVQIELDKILYIEGLKDYIKIHIEDNPRPILSLVSMKAMEEKLPADRFIRVHRSFIVQKQKIKMIDKGRIVFGKEYIPISDSYKQELQIYVNEHII